MRLEDDVVRVLSEGGYRAMGDVLNISSASFRFDFVLWSSHAGFNLVVGSALNDGLTRKIAALARALDYVESKASITVVVDAEDIGLKTRSELSRYARVLVVHEDTLEDDLRVLLPLRLAWKTVESVDPIELLRRSSARDPLIMGSSLLAGSSSEETVRESLRRFVVAPLESA